MVRESIDTLSLDLETDLIKFSGPLNAEAKIYKITNTVTVSLNLNGRLRINCSRCLNEFEIRLDKQLELYYPLNRPDELINLDEDIRQELIMEYPVKPLCKASCQGLCVKCGKDLNQGSCSCS